jgi:glucuronate isomerase
MRNPLYHWTHLELKRYFGIDQLLNKTSGKTIYSACNEQLARNDFSVKNLLLRMNVEVLCTTDDPADTLEHHKKIAEDRLAIQVLPTWRPDKVMAVENPLAYRHYIEKLGNSADIEIKNFKDLLEALSRRQDYFAQCGCKLSDHGLSAFPAADFTEMQLEQLFAKLLNSQTLSEEEAEIFRSGMLYHLALMNDAKAWTQQFHVGAIRNNNRRLFDRLGADIGCDSIADYPVAAALSKFFNRLDTEGRLTKTILYNLNPKDTEVMISMAYNYNDGSIVGKMQYGAAWWFLDQMDGMQQQLEALSHGGLLSRFIGMLTDSRSFLSFPRHEYFRRILCNLLGNDIEKGRLPASEMPFIGQIVRDICYNNAKRYLGV